MGEKIVSPTDASFLYTISRVWLFYKRRTNVIRIFSSLYPFTNLSYKAWHALHPSTLYTSTDFSIPLRQRNHAHKF